MVAGLVALPPNLSVGRRRLKFVAVMMYPVLKSEANGGEPRALMQLPVIHREVAARKPLVQTHSRVEIRELLRLRTSWARLGKRGFIRVDARRLDRDGMQGGFCSKYRDICKKTNAAGRPIQVIARHAE